MDKMDNINFVDNLNVKPMDSPTNNGMDAKKGNL